MARFVVITDRCIKDMLCVEVCIREAIQLGSDELGFAEEGRLHINTKRCIGCGACIETCPSGAIVEREDSAEHCHNLPRSGPAGKAKRRSVIILSLLPLSG